MRPKSVPDPSSTPGGDQPKATISATAVRFIRYSGGSDALPIARATIRPPVAVAVTE